MADLWRPTEDVTSGVLLAVNRQYAEPVGCAANSWGKPREESSVIITDRTNRLRITICDRNVRLNA